MKGIACSLRSGEGRQDELQIMRHGVGRHRAWSHIQFEGRPNGGHGESSWKRSGRRPAVLDALRTSDGRDVSLHLEPFDVMSGDGIVLIQSRAGQQAVQARDIVHLYRGHARR